MFLAPRRDLRVGREPAAAGRFHVRDQACQQRQAGAVAGDVRVHRQQEQPAFLVRAVELGAKDFLHRRGRRVRAQRREADEVEIDRIVANPLRRQLDDAGRLAAFLDLVGVVVRHQAAVVEQAQLADHPQRVDREIPARGAHPDRPAAGEFFQHVGSPKGEITLGVVGKRGVRFVNPGMDADLVALAGDRAHLLGVQQRRDGGIEERDRDRLAREQAADARDRLAGAVLALADAHRAFVGVAQRDRLVIGIEAQRHGAAGAVRPGGGAQAAAGAGAADDAAPGRFGPLPRFLLGIHSRFPPHGFAAMLRR